MWAKDLANARYTVKVKVLVTQSCPTLCNPMDSPWSLPGSSGIFQARILEWVAIPFSRVSLDYRQILYCLSHLGSLFSPVNICSNSWMTWGSYQQKKQVLELFQALPTTLWFLWQCSTILTLSHSIIFSYLALIIVHP